MNRPLVRRGLGTLWVGTALLGWGCSQPDDQPRSDRPLPFPPEGDEAAPSVPRLRPPVAVAEEQGVVRAVPRIERMVQSAAKARASTPKGKASSQSRLLISASDLALAVTPASEPETLPDPFAPALPGPELEPAAPVGLAPTPEAPPAAGFVSGEEPTAIDPALALEAVTEVVPAEAGLVLEADHDAQAPILGGSDDDPDLALAGLEVASDDAVPALGRPSLPADAELPPAALITPAPEPASDAATAPVPVPPPSFEAAFPAPARQQAILPKPANAPVALTSRVGPVGQTVEAARTVPEQVAPAAPASARRSIEARASAEAVGALPAPKSAVAEQGEAISTDTPKTATLAAALPARGILPSIVSTVLPQPDRQPELAANDTGATPAPEVGTGSVSSPLSSPLSSAAAALPQARDQSILGLGAELAAPAAPADETALLAAPPREAPAGFGTSVPVFDYNDELILELQVKGIDVTDTIIAYDTRQGIYLPFGTLVRILDLAVKVSDEGRYAFGWALSEDRIVGIDLRQGILTLGDKETELPPGFAVAFDGEMYIRGVDLARVLPVKVETDLRAQQVLLETLERFPFQDRIERDARRERLGQVEDDEKERWPRYEAPYLLAAIPSVDLEMRAIADSGRGQRIEQDVTLAGDIAMLNGRAFFSGNTTDGLTAASIELGRIDPDGELLGPLGATEFSIGDTSNPTIALGLRSQSGRGVSVTNSPLQSLSVFERIDLRGVLQDGYEVELYRNGILVGSTRDRVDGRYEFLQVPVDFGLNLFRLVFYGPQGQQYEELRTISVGDGRLSKGDLVYKLGAIEKDVNVLGVRDPRSIAPPDRGDWRASAEIAYGLTSGLTAIASAAWLEEDSGSRWLATGGIRTGIGPFALKADAAVGDDGSSAFSGGVAGRFGRTGLTLTHTEYQGGFYDETRTVTPSLLRRATELDLNTGILIGGEGAKTDIPINARVRYYETLTGRSQLSANLRSSLYTGGLLVSNTLEYNSISQPGTDTFYQVFGNFDLATVGRSKTRMRGSVGYALLPRPDILSAGVEADHYLDERTSVRGAINYIFASKSPQVSASARRDFDRFSLSLDGNYAFSSKAYSLALRLGLSFGRDPIGGGLLSQRESLAGSGGIALRAYRDRDGDGAYGPGDDTLPDVEFVAFNASEKTDAAGTALLTGLGSGRPVTVQVDSASLPDITLAPLTKGIEIVPRAGRIQSLDVPIVELSEAEGKVYLLQGEARREVSGVRLQLLGSDGKAVAFAKSEVDGYYFFEQLMPGTYTVAIEPAQAERLGICLVDGYSVATGAQSDIVVRDIEIRPCS